MAERVVLASGTRNEFPEVDGFLEHYGADVFHCPLCDGHEAKGRTVVLLGWAAHVAVLARKLLRWAAGVTIVTGGGSTATPGTGRRCAGRASASWRTKASPSPAAWAPCAACSSGRGA